MARFIELTYSGSYKDAETGEYPILKTTVNTQTIRRVTPNGTGCAVELEEECLYCKESYNSIIEQL